MFACDPSLLRQPAVIHKLIGLWFVGFVLCGCGQQGLTLPHVIDHRLVTPVRIRINDQDPGETSITIKAGTRVEVSASLEIADDQFRSGVDIGTVHVRLMPAGTSNKDWEKARQHYSMALEWLTGFAPEVRMQNLATIAPGDYEVRIYALFATVQNLELRETLLQTGRVIIVP